MRHATLLERSWSWEPSIMTFQLALLLVKSQDCKYCSEQKNTNKIRQLWDIDYIIII